ncbi:hypothetical protein ACQJBY_002427 [Aegilops geniculata]
MVVLAPASSFHHQRAAAAAAAAADGADQGFALLSAGQCGLADPGAPKSGSAIQFWQSHSQPPTTPPAAAPADKKQVVSAVDYGGVSSGSGGSTTCSDCGNQAKKDCPHQRCRTCCKSRGFDCTTHVRSTWIPAARRREKHPLGGDLSPPAAPATAVTKKPRFHSSQTTTTTTTSRTSTSNGTSSSQQGDRPAQTHARTSQVSAPIIQETWTLITSSIPSSADAPFRDSLPRHVRAPAVFRCVRVTSVDDGADEFAYQAAVSINGHMFRGFLYDQGADNGRTSNDEPSHAHAAAVRSISDLHLGNASAVPPDMYNTVSGALILGGMGYGNIVCKNILYCGTDGVLRSGHISINTELNLSQQVH